MKNTLLGSLYLILASSIWGGMYVVVKVLVSVIPPLELVWLRYLVAIVTLLMVGFITKQNWRIEKRYFIIITAIGIIGYAISMIDFSRFSNVKFLIAFFHLKMVLLQIYPFRLIGGSLFNYAKVTFL